MTRLDALKALAEKVEAGTVTQSDFWPSRLGVCELAGRRSPGWRAFNGSLDAAKALHEAVLPGVPWWVEIRTDDQAEAGIFLRDAGRIITARHDETSPARAWLLAILRALIAQEEGKNDSA